MVAVKAMEERRGISDDRRVAQQKRSKVRTVVAPALAGSFWDKSIIIHSFIHSHIRMVVPLFNLPFPPFSKVASQPPLPSSSSIAAAIFSPYFNYEKAGNKGRIHKGNRGCRCASSFLLGWKWQPFQNWPYALLLE
jgi:hypothetical protein